MSTGAIIGGILGGAVGSTLGGVGAPAGYALGSSIGGSIQGASAWKKGQNMGIDENNPMQINIYNDILQKRRAMESGMFFMPQQQQLMQSGMGAESNAVRATGGNVGGTVSALNMINRSTGRNLNELYGNMQQSAMQMLPYEMQMANQLYNQKFSIQSWEKQNQMTHGARMLQNSGANLAGFMANPDRASLLAKLIEEWKKRQQAGGGETTADGLGEYQQPQWISPYGWTQQSPPPNIPFQTPTF